MKKRSAGILMYRYTPISLEVMLVHPGGPFHRNRDLGAWSIPKGEFDQSEDPRDAAVRELKEETGAEITGPFIQMQPVVQKSGKVVLSWAVEGSFDPAELVSNTFPIEWPPRSGRIASVPEVDRAEWFSIDLAVEKIIPGQKPIIEELVKILTDAGLSK